MSRCESVQSTLTNDHLSTTGLVSLSDIWSSKEMKRLVRTRMLGVVRGVPGNRAPITIAVFIPAR